MKLAQAVPTEAEASDDGLSPAAGYSTQMQETYRGLLEAAPDAMVISDFDGRILLVNAETARLFGYRREELVGRAIETLMPERFQTMHHGYAARSRTRSMGEGLELAGLRKDGTEFPIEMSSTPAKMPDGMLIVSVIRDVAERRHAEMALRAREEALERRAAELTRSNADLEQFAYIAAHDLQEPLRMVASYTQLLARRYQGRLDADADEFIAYAVDGAQRMQLLIADLLTYCRVGTAGTAPRETSSVEALHRALLNLEGAMLQSGAVVSNGVMPNVTADPAQLTQLFQNIVGNAIKYRGSRPPRVHVSAARSPAGEWVFSIADNGMGIDAQYFDKIFAMFQRLHRRDEFSGTGIGLTLCKKIIERHGGRIWVESDGESGSTFHFALPDGGAKP
ncbi:MAG: sensor signal transduction histidine kinase [Hyphomicrobiales bacterium]|nr:sensor signal transduction histidine kinase [Hyphomicrobiales bacterium]